MDAKKPGHDELIAGAWSYPLFQAIFQRRARRVALGGEFPGTTTPYQSKHPPVPLDEVEEALLVMAATGISGLSLSDLPYQDGKGNNTGGNTMIQFTGRTYASACGSHGTELFFTNDNGTYLVNLRDRITEKVAEYEGASDFERLLAAFRASTVKILDHRLEVPMLPQVTYPLNQWSINRPGSTMFVPVSDVTLEYINLLLFNMDEPVRRYIYDDMNGNAEPLKKYADQGLLDRTRALPLSAAEARYAVTITGSEQALMLQNAYLAAQAIGLGGWIFTASVGPVILGATPLTKGLGFRCYTPEKAAPNKPDFVPIRPVPVGLDGLFQAYCPPYFPSMADAVQAIHDAKWGPNGIYTSGPAALRDRAGLDRQVPKHSEWCLDAAKDLCEYIWKTYGRFPATMDPMQMNIWFQAHHLDTEFYDRFYKPGSYQQSIARHMESWHGWPGRGGK